MADLKIYSVSDEYIKYLRQDERLTIVFDNKEDARSHTRKYLGVAFVKNDFHYFIPFSSPKNSDYQIEADGSRTIRKSIIPIIRMTTTDTVSGEVELKGTLKISNMIPVPEQELTPYQISAETDVNYKIVVQKEFEFIRANEKMIMKNASVLYNQKTKADTLYKNKSAPKYLSSTVDFLYAEQRCQCFIDGNLENLGSSIRICDSTTKNETEAANRVPTSNFMCESGWKAPDLRHFSAKRYSYPSASPFRCKIE